jgi:protein gp37
MAENSKIEWCDHTWNPWWGCTKVSAGCAHCYADTLAHRYGFDIWGRNKGRRMMSENYWKQPLAWDRKAAKDGVRRRVFCASMADVFEGEETMAEEAREPVKAARLRLFNLIMDTPHLDWLLLTKRPENIAAMLPLGWGEGWANVWLGTSVEDQAAADKRIPHLLSVPARVRFLSCEPLLGPVDLDSEEIGGLHAPGCGDPTCTCGNRGIDWVIVGGESGGGARPMHPEWARSLRDQCTSAGVAFHFKQWGEYTPGITSVDPIQYGESFRIGKKAAGRVLDGRTWDELPL